MRSDHVDINGDHPYCPNTDNINGDHPYCPSTDNINGDDPYCPSTVMMNGGGDLHFLNLSLCTNPSSQAAASTSQPAETTPAPQPKSRNGRVERRRTNQIIGAGKTENITAPYPWATTRRAVVQGLQQLLVKGINTISGRVQCKRCDKVFDIEYDVQDKFREVALFIMKYREEMRHRAPVVWTNPTLPDCKYCSQQNCVKPVVAKKRNINWLFLYLGQMLGCCKLSELKYFCKHTKRHRTGAKDRVLYLTYLEISQQLDPDATFHR